MQEQLENHAFFEYEKDIEYLLASMEILAPYQVNPKIRQVYDEDFVLRLKGKYPLLFELYGSLSKEFSTSFLEFLLEYKIKDFRLEDFFSYLKTLSPTKFLAVFLDQQEQVICNAMISEERQVAYYQKNKDRFLHFYGIEVLFQKTEWFIALVEKYVLEFRTEKAQQYLNQHTEVIQEWEKRVLEGTKKEGSLSYSESIMGKSFFNRGPYENFYFMASLFIPMMACRWFGKDQILIFDGIRWDKPDDHKLSDALKMMSDRTRYRILVLLKEHKRLNGVELSEKMKLSTSTVSYHMSQLKSCGLVHEESAGSTKYYSVNELSIKNYLHILEKTFL